MAESTAIDSTTPAISNQPSRDGSSEIASPALTSVVTKPVNDEPEQPTQEKTVPAALLIALASQLEYYFSAVNLRRDTYLRTIMGLNSGFVPTTVLATFANVNRIIAQHDADGSLLSGTLDVPTLIRKAALENSQILDVVVLDTEGSVLASFTDYKPNEESPQITLVAVGPSNDSAKKQLGRLRTNKETAENPSKETSRSSTVSELQPVEVVKQQHVIILRDMPESITPDEVKQIFEKKLQKDAGPTVKDIRSEVGHCWFVTLDNASKEDLVALLFEFRDEKLSNGEPIKARLKTESNVKSFYTAVPNGQMGSSPREGGYRGRGSRSGFRGPVYAGDRYNPSKPSQFYTPSPTDGPDGTTYRRPYSGGGRSYNGRGSGGRGYGGRANYTSSSSGASRTTKEQPSVPPPPLVEEHFPTLAGNDAENVEGTGTTVEKLQTETNDDEKDVIKDEQNKNDLAPTVTLKHSPPQPSFPSGGYAAALLKASSAPQKLTHTASKGKYSKEQKNGPSSLPSKSKSKNAKKEESASKQSGSNNSTKSASTTSTGVPTDDCSTDEKSSLSSTPEVEKGISTAKTVSAWGGGRSFAEVVKKPEGTSQAAK